MGGAHFGVKYGKTGPRNREYLNTHVSFARVPSFAGML